MIFWHESSATKPGGTASDGRAREPGAAKIPAMPVLAVARTSLYRQSAEVRAQDLAIMVL
jgi:hypothetical protein